MNEIGLKKLSNDTYEITPYEAKFEGRSVTIGNGIKRGFSNINPTFNPPCDRYIEKFFTLEMQSVFQFTDLHFADLFIQQSNDFFSRIIYLTQLQMYLDDPERKLYLNIKFDKDKDDTLQKMMAQLESHINVIEQYDLSNTQKFELVRLVHTATLKFIDKLLRETKSSNQDGIANCIFDQHFELDRQPGGLLYEESNNFGKKSFVCLIIIIALIVYVYDFKQMALNIISKI